MKPSNYPPKSPSRGSSDRHNPPAQKDLLNKFSRGVTTGGGRPFSQRTIERIQRPDREGK
jgi:hypothetical protein